MLHILEILSENNFFLFSRIKFIFIKDKKYIDEPQKIFKFKCIKKILLSSKRDSLNKIKKRRNINLNINNRIWKKKPFKKALLKKKTRKK